MNSRLAGALALVLIAAGLGSYLIRDGGDDLQQGEPPIITAASAESETRAALDSALGVLRSVTDPASADAVAPAIQASTFKLSAVAAVGAGLPKEGRDGLSRIAGAAGEGIQAEIKRIQGIPGAYDVLKPKLDRLLFMLNVILGQSYESLQSLDRPS